MHQNSRLIEALYSAIRANDPDAIAACYTPDATFKDIAFDLEGRKEIRDMWRMICDAQVTVVDFKVESADDHRGSGRWWADYVFNRKEKPPGRRVKNTLCSEFRFRDGLILRHEDKSDLWAWAKQAFAFPENYGAMIGFVRRHKARAKLDRFIAANPE